MRIIQNSSKLLKELEQNTDLDMPAVERVEIQDITGISEPFISKDSENPKNSLAAKGSNENVHLPQIRTSSAKKRTSDDENKKLLPSRRKDSETTSVVRSRSVMSLGTPRSRNSADLGNLRKSRSFAPGIPRRESSEQISVNFIDNTKLISDNVTRNGVNHDLSGRWTKQSVQTRHKEAVNDSNASKISGTDTKDGNASKSIDANAVNDGNTSKTTNTGTKTGNTALKSTDRRKRDSNRKASPRSSLRKAIGLQEHIRRENARYNEYSSKQLLFQKWLQSTDREFPPASENDADQ